MKKLITLHFFLAMLVIAVLFTACQKGSLSSTTTNQSTTTSGSSIAVTSTGNITIATSSTASSTTTDSLVLMHACTPGSKPDTIALSALPAAISTYLTANYSGYTFKKAFKVVDKSGTLIAYDVIIIYNGKPVGIKFDTSGNLVAVLEQREHQDVDGQGWHKGGRFDNRDGLHGDTIAVSALPAAIKTYFTTNYPSDTLVHAVVTKDTSYIVFSVNKGMYATAFNSKLAFVKRVQLNPIPVKKHIAIAQADLPASITTYLTTTYPGYAFDKAFVEKTNTTIDKYVVLIDASGTRYAVTFDASGTFVKTITIK